MIIGNKVYLRPIEPSDTDLIVSWRNNPRVRRQFIFRKQFTNEMHINWLENHVKTGDVIQYIIVEKNNDTPIGSVYYSHVDRDNECAEFGIFIGEDTGCGRGLGHEAMELFIKYGFDVQHFHRIYLRVIRTNENAHRLYQKVGFKEDAVIKDMVKVEGEFLDIIMMSIYANP